MDRVEAFESVIDTEDMSEEEIIKAKVKLLKDALSGKFPDISKMNGDDQKKVQRFMGPEQISLSFFTMLMRLRYLEGKLPQEGPQA